MNPLDIALASLTFLTIREKIVLRNNIDSLNSLAVLSIEDISQIVGRNILRAVWSGRETMLQVEKGISLMEAQKIFCVRYDDTDYPSLLKEISEPPYLLFYRGAISCLQKSCVSVVGTRSVCQETAKAALSFSKEAADNGETVVSGNATGIDFFAHKGALSSAENGSTAAVLPCGIDTIVPVSHKALIAKIIQTGGAVISEYIPGCPAEAWRFVQRNRIIAALSPATVVIQAPHGSGALIEASFAMDYNRELMFHKSGFCEAASVIDRQTCRLLDRTKNGAKKKSRSAENYIESGAAIIENYEDYKNVLKDAPGTHSLKDPQFSLRL